MSETRVRSVTNFFGGNTAYLPHEPFLAHEPVGSADDAIGHGPEYARGDLQVQKTGVVHKNKVGTFSGGVHVVLCVGELCCQHIRHGKGAYKRAKGKVGLFGAPVLRCAKGKSAVYVRLTGLYLHFPGFRFLIFSV